MCKLKCNCGGNVDVHVNETNLLRNVKNATMECSENCFTLQMASRWKSRRC